LDVTPQIGQHDQIQPEIQEGPTGSSQGCAEEGSAATKAADAVSLDSLKKAKELATQLGGIKQAKAAIAALAELVDLGRIFRPRRSIQVRWAGSADHVAADPPGKILPQIVTINGFVSC
jgi:hypothetical protein